jgi:hypothetical protein
MGLMSRAAKDTIKAPRERAVAKVRQFDEVCFFRTASASRVAGAPIHDGFIARKGDRLVLAGTGISIAGAEHPLAEAVVQTLQSQINSAFQHTGDNVREPPRATYVER